MSEQQSGLRLGGKTGWPPGLLQDDSRELSQWFASRPGARELADRRAAEILAERGGCVRVLSDGQPCGLLPPCPDCGRAVHDAAAGA